MNSGRSSAAELTRGNWLSASPTSGTTPSSLSALVSPAGLSAGTYTGSDRSLQFNKALFDGALYRPFSADIVLAARLRVGAVVGSSLSFTNAALYVPPQERLFAG